MTARAQRVGVRGSGGITAPDTDHTGEHERYPTSVHLRHRRSPRLPADLTPCSSDEERMLRDTVRQLRQRPDRPRTWPTGSKRAPSPRSWPKRWGPSGCSGMHLEGYGCAGHQRHPVRPGLPRTRSGRQRGPVVRVGPGIAGHVPHLEVRLRGPEAGVASPHGGGRGHRLLRPHRTRLGQRPVLDAHHRPPSATATTGCSTAPRCGSPTAASPTWPSCGPVASRTERTSAYAGFIVPTDTPGFIAPRHPRASSRCEPRSPRELILDDVRLPDSAPAPRGVARCAGPLSCLNEARYGILWGAVGAGTGLL